MKNGVRENIHPKEIQKLLNKVEGTEEEALISRIALRSMKQAKYTVNNLGHSDFPQSITAILRLLSDVIGLADPSHHKGTVAWKAGSKENEPL